ncbi:helix-turn-helix domain-containing protein [Streptomyces sp. NPDC088910]|uniref:helix-turn-helix domain-containing protein n=1 Tax=Streptomyces sp. NPDC088910 TaxID=3365911 RepID=UPI00380F7372
MATVHHWTGLEARALRSALRLSVRAFAEHLGVGIRTVSKWEKLLTETEPRPDTQAILDTALARASADTHARFARNLSDAVTTRSQRHTPPAVPQAWEYESWADDLDRVIIALSHQDFAVAGNLLHRRLDHFVEGEANDRGLYLFARSTALLGDLRRDRGVLWGPLSARHAYSIANGLFSGLDIPRRLAQTELSLALVDEMSGKVEQASRTYERLTCDGRLSGRDRSRSRLWLGRSASKLGDNDRAVKVMTEAAREFEDLAEPGDWSVAHQKIALAHRAKGGLTKALRHIDIARSGGSGDSPLQRVRLSTAHGHVLMSDPNTRDSGLAILNEAAEVAGRYGLGHQLRSIEGIRRSEDVVPNVVPPRSPWQ